ncbi:hypothetical protein FS749_005409 [Ceratobasidium sp. UAMH 11750]|nr:hypothetical protein FS749_005409 [Ceratobasidium sp. UAMH 11750]
MVNLNPRFRGLLRSIVLALAVANALPRNERELLEPGIDDSGIHATARGESLGTQMGVMEQRGTAAMLEVGRFGDEKAYSDEAPTSLIESGAWVSGNPEARRIGSRVPVIANNPHLVSGNMKHMQSRSRQFDFDEVEAAIREAVGSVSNGAQAQKRRKVEPPVEHDHTRDPVIVTGDNNHGHTQTQNRPHLEPGSRLPRLHNRKSNRPRRLHDYQDEDSESEDTLIAPPSARIQTGDEVTLRSSTAGIASTPTKLVKKPKSAVPTGLYRAVRPATTGSTGANMEGQMDQGGGVVRRGHVTDDATSVSEAARSVNTPPVSGGTSGAIDILSTANGTRLGSLSVSFTAASDAAQNSATALAYIIDATTNPAKQTTFYMRRYDNQTPLLISPSTNPETQPTHDLLVSLQVAGYSPLCATFNPSARDVQMFGLASCLDTTGVGNSSQMFRYSPGTSVVRPFYRVEADNQAAMTELEDDLGLEYPILGSDSNATTPVYFSPDLLFRPVSFLDGSAPSADPSQPPILGVQSASDPGRMLVIGDDGVVSRISGGEGQGVLMVFRRVHASAGEQDVWVEREGRNLETGEDYAGGSSGPEAGGVVKARSVGLMFGYTEPVQDDTTTEDSQETQSRVKSVSASHEAIPPLRPEPSPPAPKMPPTAPDSTTSHNELEESGPELEDTPLPKPVINVAYFGDSGRSPPVPPEAQADGARAILLAVAGKDRKPGAVTLAADSGKDTERVYLVGPEVKAKGVSIAGMDSTDRLPVDASD